MKRSGFSSIRSLRQHEEIPAGEPRRYRNGRGYIRLRWKVGTEQYVEEYEHRIVAGRPDPWLHVHHINGVKDDNRPENLEVLTREEHGRKHAEESWPEDARGKRGDHWPYRCAADKAKAERQIVRKEARAAEVKRMRELYEEGKSLPQVAEIVGISDTNVYRRLKAAGVRFRTPSDYANPVDSYELVDKYMAGRSQQSLAAEYRVTSQRIKDTLVAAGCPIRRPGRPKSHPRMQENSARLAVRQRSGGICEKCGAAQAREWHHRQNRSQGGLWTAANGMDLCTSCHRYVTEHPEESYRNGWSVRSTADPAEVPVLVTTHPGGAYGLPEIEWRLLDDKGGWATYIEEAADAA